MKFKYKVEIVIDEEKVINVYIYDTKEMYEFIRNMFNRFDLAEIKTDKPYHLIFADKGRNRDYGALGKAMLDLYYSDWFLNYAKKLFWHNNVNESVEDVLKQLGNKTWGDSQWRKHLNHLKTRNVLKQ